MEAVVANVTTFSKWTFDDGVISGKRRPMSYEWAERPLKMIMAEAPSSDDPNAVFKGWFIRGLAEARARFPNTELAQYIETYITVQVSTPLLSLRVHTICANVDFGIA